MSPEDTHKPVRIYIGGLILGVNTLYMFFCFFKLFAVVGNAFTVEDLRYSSEIHKYWSHDVDIMIDLPCRTLTSHATFLEE